MTLKDKKVIAKLIGGGTGFYFLIAFMSMASMPEIWWDTALVRAGHQSFWFAAILASMAWVTLKLISKYHDRLAKRRK
jgi:hypothetical protein